MPPVISRHTPIEALPTVLSIRELAEFLGLSERAVRHHIDRRRIQSVRLGHRIMITRDAVKQFLQGE